MCVFLWSFRYSLSKVLICIYGYFLNFGRVLCCKRIIICDYLTSTCLAFFSHVLRSRTAYSCDFLSISILIVMLVQRRLLLSNLIRKAVIQTRLFDHINEFIKCSLLKKIYEELNFLCFVICKWLSTLFNIIV